MDGVYFLEDCDVDANFRIQPLPDDKSKFSMVLVFAQWCHNCTGIKPEYQSLVNVLGNTVRLYAIDGTGSRGDNPSNESEQALMKRVPEMVKPFQFRGFPSIYLFDPAGSCIAEFNEERTSQGLMKFVKQNNAA